MLYIEEEDFFIDSKEVSCKEYAQFITATGYKCPSDWTDGKVPDGRMERPVVNVSYKDAESYARWAGKRLPSDKEWLTASREAEKLKIHNFCDDECDENVAEWTSTPFLYKDRHFRTIRRGYVPKECCDKVPVVHKAPMFEEDRNNSTGFRCVKDNCNYTERN